MYTDLAAPPAVQQRRLQAVVPANLAALFDAISQVSLTYCWLEAAADISLVGPILLRT